MYILEYEHFYQKKLKNENKLFFRK